MPPQPTRAEPLTHAQLNLPTPPPPPLDRFCLITVGATAPFTPLVSAAFGRAFLTALINAGYTRLVIQAGSDAASFQDVALRFAHPSLQISVFDFVDDLSSVMVMCGTGEGERGKGVVICHAGTGTVLDAMILNVPLIVIPNPVLQDNHQLELAEELQKQRYALHGDLNNLADSLLIHESQKPSFPTNTPANPITRPPATPTDKPPTIWSIARHMTSAGDQQESGTGASMAPAMDEREREAFERLVEG